MFNLFELAEACLHQPDTSQKLMLSHRAKVLLDDGRLDFTRDKPVHAISAVRFPTKPQLLPPKQMPSRGLGSREGVIAFFHAIAHVEIMAVSLAWDLLYRFRGLPMQFYQDWLIVADEEAQHFELIRQHLLDLGIDYGDLPAHSGLWDHAVATAADLLGRLAMVPRCMEARGLDVTPGIITKFKAQGDTASVAILTRILTDEVKHVERGSFWFKWLCQQKSLEPDAEYQRLISQYYLGGKPKGPFNRKMRLTAGFTEAELDWLEQSR
jgi:uncharacterized ferritin-like protein (DUF455 family)